MIDNSLCSPGSIKEWEGRSELILAMSLELSNPSGSELEYEIPLAMKLEADENRP